MIPRGLNPGEVDEALNRQHRVRRVERFLKPSACVRPQAQRRRSRADRRRVEIRGLQQHFRRCFGHFRIESAHEAGECDRSPAALDQQHFGRQRPFDVVESLEPFPRLCECHLDTIDFRGIEGMHGLAQVRHDVVRQIDQPVDWPQPDVPEPQLHPQWGRSQSAFLNPQSATHDDPTVSRTGFRGGDRYRKLPKLVGLQLGKGCNRIGFQRAAQDGGHLPGDAVVAPQIRPMGDRLVVDFQDPVVERFHRQRFPGWDGVTYKHGFLLRRRNTKRITRHDHAGAGPPGDFGGAYTA